MKQAQIYIVFALLTIFALLSLVFVTNVIDFSTSYVYTQTEHVNTNFRAELKENDNPEQNKQATNVNPTLQGGELPLKQDRADILASSRDKDLKNRLALPNDANKVLTYNEQQELQNLDKAKNSLSHWEGTYYPKEHCYVPANRTTCAPSFIIAGAMKCGTTSLFQYLMNHPDVLPLKYFWLDGEVKRISVVAEKEVRFFNDPNFSQLLKRFGETAIHNYLDLFADIPPTAEAAIATKTEHLLGKITGEATPMYICQKDVPSRIYDLLPYVKILMMLRNPVDRSWSEYWFRKSLMPTTNRVGSNAKASDEENFKVCMQIELDIVKYCNLEEIIPNVSMNQISAFFMCFQKISTAVYRGCNDPDLEHFCKPNFDINNCNPGSVLNSIYFVQLFPWLLTFPDDNIKVIQSEQFYANSSKVMVDVTKYLRLPEYDWSNLTKNVYNIVNPKTKHNMNIVTDKNINALQIGEGSTSEYPPLSSATRKLLSDAFLPYNQALARLTLQDEFYDWNK